MREPKVVRDMDKRVRIAVIVALIIGLYLSIPPSEPDVPSLYSPACFDAPDTEQDPCGRYAQ